MPKGKRRNNWKHLVWPPKWWHGAFVLGLLLITFLWVPSGKEFLNQNPKATSLMYIRAREASEKSQQWKLQWQWVPLKKISPELAKAVIAAEDWNFFSHRGFDFGELKNALSDAIVDFSLPRGASTITQQLAKNLYLSESKNPFRKLIEAMITIKLEFNLSKSKVIELYLNVIEWGQGIFGAEAAARHYFGVSAEEITKDQAAFLAALIPNPRTVYNPKLHPRQVQKRKKVIFERMAKVSLPISR